MWPAWPGSGVRVPGIPAGFGHRLLPSLVGPRFGVCSMCVAPRDLGGGRGGSRSLSHDWEISRVSVGEAALEAQFVWVFLKTNSAEALTVKNDLSLILSAWKKPFFEGARYVTCRN